MRDIVSAIFSHDAAGERYRVLTLEVFRGYTQLHTYAAAGPGGRRRNEHLKRDFLK
jgi:hypothetical protein